MGEKMTEQEIDQIAKKYWRDKNVRTITEAILIKIAHEAYKAGLGAAVSASPQPRCPKCALPINEKAWANGDQNAVCSNIHVFPIRQASDFAQFFAPAPAQEAAKKITPHKGKESTCKHCGVKIYQAINGLWLTPFTQYRHCAGKVNTKHEPVEPLAAQPVENRCKDFDWQCENCGFRDDPSIPGKPTICPKCGANRWEAAEPISGGASTGEQPPPQCTKCGGNLTALPTVHCPRCTSTNFIIEAARPSEPSAPKVEPRQWKFKPWPQELNAIMHKPADYSLESSDGYALHFSDVELVELAQGHLQIIPLEQLAAPSVAGTQPTAELRRLALEACDGFDAQPNHGDPNAKRIMDALRAAAEGAAQGTPQVEEIAREIWDTANDSADVLAILRKHLVCAPAQPGTEEKR